MKFANKFCRDLHKSYTLGFGLLETRINTGFDLMSSQEANREQREKLPKKQARSAKNE